MNWCVCVLLYIQVIESAPLYLAVDLQLCSGYHRRPVEVLKQVFPLFVEVSHKVNFLHTHHPPGEERKWKTWK